MLSRVTEAHVQQYMIIHILISIVFYFILMYLSVNLLGLLVRGLFSNPELDKLKQEGHEFIKNEIEKSQRADKWRDLMKLGKPCKWKLLSRFFDSHFRNSIIKIFQV